MYKTNQAGQILSGYNQTIQYLYTQVGKILKAIKASISNTHSKVIYYVGVYSVHKYKCTYITYVT